MAMFISLLSWLLSGVLQAFRFHFLITDEMSSLEELMQHFLIFQWLKKKKKKCECESHSHI